MSQETHIATEEVLPLNIIAGQGDQEDEDAPSQVISCTGRTADFFCNDKHHRKLAVCSIICGISCIGIKALTHSILAEKETDAKNAATSLQKAKKFGLISIGTWVAILVSIPLLMALISYLVTLQD